MGENNTSPNVFTHDRYILYTRMRMMNTFENVMDKCSNPTNFI